MAANFCTHPLMEDPYLFQPLLIPRTTTIASTTTTTTSLDDRDADSIKLCSSNSSIVLRLLFLISIGIISIWANYEASKGFGITLVNNAKESPEGKRFTLFYISNDKAARIVQSTSSFVENLLYPNINHTKKPVIHHVTLRLASKNLPNLVKVDANTNSEFVISISPLMLMDHTKNLDHAIKSIVLQGMARVWLWNPESRAPPWLLDGMVEYINGFTAGFGPVRNFGGHKSHGDPFGNFCLGDKDPKVVAKFLDYFESWHEKGFIQRLNKALRDDHQWIDRTVEDVLGISVQNLCDSYKNTSHGLSSW